MGMEQARKEQWTVAVKRGLLIVFLMEAPCCPECGWVISVPARAAAAAGGGEPARL
jgi:hypothetical protein